MRTIDLIGTAVASTFRSRTRTLLTVLAIFVGAFTLTLTNGLGTGINRYLDDTVAGFGAADVLTVTKQTDTQPADDGPREYDPDTVSAGPEGGVPGMTVGIITAEDLDTIAALAGIERVEPVRSVTVDYVQVADGTRYVATVGSFIPGQQLQLDAGAEPDVDSDEAQIAIPVSYVEPLGFDDPADAVGGILTIVLRDATGVTHEVEAAIAGVVEETFSATGSGSLIPNDALTTALSNVQRTGLADDQQEQYTQAQAWVAADATADEIAAVQDRLAGEGFDSQTVEQQLGAFKTVIDGIVLVLNAFAVIALLAASFGIVNTLLMSVQERTREIGLMKAMGMSSPRVFTLFSLEAAFIGFLGSAIGAAAAILAGTAVSGALASTLLSDLPGLQLLAFDPVSVATTIVVIMLVAFLAGTLPAARAARQDPVTSLRYE